MDLTILVTRRPSSINFVAEHAHNAPPMRRKWLEGLVARALLFLVATWLCTAATALGQDAGPASPEDAGVAAEGPDAREDDARIAEIHALVAGTLAVSVEPQGLFDVPLADEDAIGVERARIRTLLRAVDVDAGPPPRSARARPAPSSRRSAAPAASASAEVDAMDSALWSARIALDRARLEFYSLPRDRRDALLAAQQKRREAARPVETEEQRRAREAARDRQRALDAAKAARSEAERMVAEEDARLIGVESAVEAARARFRAARADLVARRDILLGWQRRARDAMASTPAEADTTYDAVRRTLRTSRDDLSKALDDLGSSGSEVPALGPDPLSDVPPDIPTEEVRERRASAARAVREALADEGSLREERASTLLEEITTLNRERLGLIPYLSPGKRSALMGFTAAGLDQARSEARHLVLILRYHRHIAAGWIRALRDRDRVRGASVWTIAAIMVPWLLALAVFLWWRRRRPGLLALAEQRSAEHDRSEGRTVPSPASRAIQFIKGVHGPLEWLLLFAATTWLLPAEVFDLLEVQLLSVVVGWTLGGALIVDAINTLAAWTETSGARSAGPQDRLRLRSLRLVGRVVVALVLTLVLTARLVGQGTVYSWVLSTCWFAAIPVFLLLVRWWRETVFERIDRLRRKSGLQAWILRNRRGWKSFLAAMIAGVQVFGVGSVKTVRSWIAGFDLARRALAYLFKRELDRLAEGKPAADSAPLPAGALAKLAPDRPAEAWVACPADHHVASLRGRLAEGRGGVVALVGHRGLGKSTLLARLGAETPDALALPCDASSTVTTVRAALEAARAAPRLVLVDEAHAVIKPIVGGLRVFDEVLAFARARSERTLWIFAIDGVVWPFLRRARDARPMFDEIIALEPWTDEQIGALLALRSADAGVTPSFEGLLDKLPPSANEVDKQEALAGKRAGYFRVVWDYARGNPAIALEVWRTSLTATPDGATHVRPLKAPNPAPLEVLPDATLFILRAILQMTPATLPELAEATRLSEAQVEDALRFGEAHGYLAQEKGRVSITWAWLRSVTLFLERRHLLVNP